MLTEELLNERISAHKCERRFFAYEHIGTGMFAIFVSYHISNATWWKHLFRGRYTPLRVFGTVVNLALAIIMLVLHAEMV